MSFKFNPSPDLAVVVKIAEPLDKGKVRNSEIVVRYRLRTNTEVQDDLASSGNGTLPDVELLDRDIVDIEGIKDDSGTNLPYSSELLTELMKWHWIRTPLINGWLEAQTGVKEAQEKN
ncbi:hypothetical protein [Carnimonas bestiolae]|uniref:hypothetical protein n=1 Tax=Carnimonas bestiolae TaxID=3402172 RepID=UPI003EDC70AB